MRLGPVSGLHVYQPAKALCSGAEAARLRPNRRRGEAIGCLLSIWPRNKNNAMDAMLANHLQSNSPAIFISMTKIVCSLPSVVENTIVSALEFRSARSGSWEPFSTLLVNVPVGVIAY